MTIKYIGNNLLLAFLHTLCRSNLHDLSSQLFALTDPTYMVRAIPSNASDNVYCTLLAHSAIHGAMAGYSFTVGMVNGRHAYIPFHVSITSICSYLITFDPVKCPPFSINISYGESSLCKVLILNSQIARQCGKSSNSFS